jgi:hypothetical protein
VGWNWLARDRVGGVCVVERGAPVDRLATAGDELLPRGWLRLEGAWPPPA